MCSENPFLPGKGIKIGVLKMIIYSWNVKNDEVGFIQKLKSMFGENIKTQDTGSQIKTFILKTKSSIL